MNIIVCVDNKMGTMFNGRRQSRDKVLCRKIVDLAGDGVIRVRPYSYPLFEDICANVICDDNYLNSALEDDFCFVEGDDVAPYAHSIKKLVIFRWNRDYPRDKVLDIDLSHGWIAEHCEEFEGSSHDNITMEVYAKE